MFKRLKLKNVKQLIVTMMFMISVNQLSVKIIQATPEMSASDSVQHIPTLMAASDNLTRDYYKVFIDPGHGGKDPGAVVGDAYEKTINLDIALKVEALLKAKGVDVEMSRDTDVYLTLSNRAQKANNYSADAFVSIHANAASNLYADGVETFHGPYSITGQGLATNIQTNMVSYTGAKNRGVKSGYYVVLQEASMPAALVEVGFMTNPIELNNLLTNSYQQSLARAIADGIYKYLVENVEIKQSSTNEPVIGTGEVVNAETLNVRSGASASHSQIGSLKKGQSVNILAEMSNGWYKIEYNNGVGYVSGAYIDRTKQNTTVIGTGEVFNTNTLNVRSGASTSHSQIGTLTRGQKVEILEVMSNGWYQIKFNGGIGYVSNTYINWSKESSTVIGTGEVVNTNTLNVRSGASTSHSQIGSLTHGQKVNILAQMSNGWYKIEYNGGVGYVSNDYIKQVQDTSNVIGIGEVINTNTLNVRSGASTSHSQIGSLSRGQKVEILATMSNGWYQIKYNNGVGYVSNTYINWSKDTSTVIRTGEVINADTLNVRSGASTTHSKIGSLSRGQKVEILATHDGWHQIKYGNGNGYVSATYIK